MTSDISRQLDAIATEIAQLDQDTTAGAASIARFAKEANVRFAQLETSLDKIAADLDTVA